MSSKPPMLRDVGGFTPVIDCLIPLVGLNGAATYGAMWRFANNVAGVCYASQRRIARRVGVSRYTVNKYIAILCQAGLLHDLTPDRHSSVHTYAVVGKEIMAEQSDSSQPLRPPAAPPVKNCATTGTNLDTPVKEVDTPVKEVDTPVKNLDTPVKNCTTTGTNLDTKIHIDTNQDTFPGKKQSLYMGDELSIDDELSTGDEREIVAESGDNQEDYDQEEEILTSRELELLCEDISVTLKSDSDTLTDEVFSLWGRSRASETHMLKTVRKVAERVFPRVHTEKLGSRAARYFIVSLKNELKVVGWL